MTADDPPRPLIPADRVNGTAVFSARGEKLGKIEDIAIDKVSGVIAYAILGHGGVLGFGDHFHPVPWRLLTYDTEKRGYIIPCEREELERAPGLNADELSGWNDGSSRDAIFEYYARYGINPYLA